MTNVIDEREALEQRQAEERKAAKERDRVFRESVQAVFKTKEGRRVLAAFLEVAGEGSSVLRENPVFMGHAAGWQEAGVWWLHQVRTHCPEREQQMRNESREAARVASQDDNSDE